MKALEGHEGKVFSRVEPRHKRELVKILIEMVSVLEKSNFEFRVKSSQ
jgi:hypothetical protein